MSGSPRVTALIPCHDDDKVADVVRRTRPHVDDILIVGDDPPPAMRSTLDALAGPGVSVSHRCGPPAKGDALAFGSAVLLARAHPPDLIAAVDADGQHPPEFLPAFLDAAGHADLVIGDRRERRTSMPALRRVGNDLSSAMLSLLVARRLPDTQCGMRVHRAATLRRIPLPPGGFEAETRHLLLCARAGLRIAWVPIPAVYEGEQSHFRPGRDSLKVLGAMLGVRSGRRDRVWRTTGRRAAPGARETARA